MGNICETKKEVSAAKGVDHLVETLKATICTQICEDGFHLSDSLAMHSMWMVNIVVIPSGLENEVFFAFKGELYELVEQ